MLTPSSIIKVALVGMERATLDALRGPIDQEPDLQVLSSSGDAEDAGQPNVPEQVDIVLFDLDGPGSAANFNRLAEAAAANRTIALTPSPTPAIGFRAFLAGASGLLSTSESPDMLLRAIRKVHAGEVWFGRAATVRLIELARASGRRRVPNDGVPPLNLRERRLITMVGEGRTNAEIARRMLTSEAIVKSGLAAIFRKLGLSGRFDLMAYAARHGFVADRSAREAGSRARPARPRDSR